MPTTTTMALCIAGKLDYEPTNQYSAEFQSDSLNLQRCETSNSIDLLAPKQNYANGALFFSQHTSLVDSHCWCSPGWYFPHGSVYLHKVS